VHDIREDERGTVWFCTDRGLFRFDGRDWSHYGGPRTGWVPLGRADSCYEGLEPQPRGAWRFSRSAGVWERFAGRRAQPAKLKLRTSKEAAVRCVAWTDHVAGELDGKPVDAEKFVVRLKPDEGRIVTGGLPALPRLPVGKSVWRYLALEPTPLTEPAERPAWTCEGRLIPAGPKGHDAPDPPEPGRFAATDAPDGLAAASRFDEALFAFPLAAKVSFEWSPSELLSVLVRLKRRSSDDPADPIVLDRVWQAIEQVRPAGVRARLAVEETIVRGDENGRS
jgi:hypothetical protein